MKFSVLSTLRVLAFSGATLMAAAGAQATPMSFDWISTVQSDVAAKGLHAGDKIAGTLVFDTAGGKKTPSSYGNGISGYQYYDTPAMTATFSIGGQQQSVLLTSTMVNNDGDWGDSLILRGTSAAYGPVTFLFADYSQAALSSLALPNTLDPVALSFATVSFGNWPNMIDAAITQIAPSAAKDAGDVPEPASLALFGAAFAGLAAARRRMR